MKKFLLIIFIIGAAVIIYDQRQEFKFLITSIIYKETSPQETENNYIKQKAAQLKENENNSNKVYGFCDNNYFPLIENTSWKYNFNLNDHQEVVEIRVPPKEGEQYFLSLIPNSDFRELKLKVDCTLEGINLESLYFLIGNLKNQALNREEKIISKNQNGIFLPPSLDKKFSWSYESISKKQLILTETPNNPGVINQNINEILTADFINKGEEQIKTPFREKLWTKKILLILKITEIDEARVSDYYVFDEKNKDQFNSNDSLKENYPNLNSPENQYPKREFNCNLWFAKQTGLVKSVCQEKEGLTASYELRSYFIPSN
jgi:hypothetical protein